MKSVLTAGFAGFLVGLLSWQYLNAGHLKQLEYSIGRVVELNRDLQGLSRHLQRHSDRRRHKQVKYFNDDLETVFNVKHTEKIVVGEDDEKLLANYDAKKSDYYLEHADSYDKKSELYEGYKSSESDRQIYVKWAGAEMGYGVFANLDLPAGQYLGDYTGALVGDGYNTDYMWSHPFVKFLSDGKNITYGIDGRYTGNMLRFVNDVPKSENAKVVFFLRSGEWTVGYVTSRAISKDEQLFVSYGSGYWDARQFHDPNGAKKLKQAKPSTHDATTKSANKA